MQTNSKQHKPAQLTKLIKNFQPPLGNKPCGQNKTKTFHNTDIKYMTTRRKGGQKYNKNYTRKCR